MTTKTYYEVTNCETGKTYHLTAYQCREHFGRDEFQEMLQGYDPRFVVIEIDEAKFQGRKD